MLNIEYEKTKNHTLYSRKELPTDIMHWHESVEVCRLISGNATFLIENSTYSFKPGDIVIISSKNLHCFNCEGENLVDILLIPIHDFIPIIRSYPTMPSYISREKIDSIPRLKDELDYLFERINEEFDSKQTYARS